ncbi:methyl-accepting chemotaxis protein [Paenibacillus sediminis]|uniref:Methyl-accepting chemotaxis protein n=1 Tax=Paenibacillus sediminis TaxID=664909 RepID=A0ABS4H4Q8_9BACL|nr:methyl-accepting chemotaxis protein [Paenibacillus sediminis]MBP1937237.1 methyl-accepting chemotaxis protein [Paenibacillus sediminis]
MNKVKPFFRFKGMTIRKRLIISFVLMLWVPSLLIGYSSYHSSKNEIEKQLMLSASENVKLLNSQINSQLQMVVNGLNSFSTTINSASYEDANMGMLEHDFSQFTRLQNEVTSIYAAADNGTMIRFPNVERSKDSDPRQAPWYKQAMDNKGKVMVTEPYINSATGDTIITLAKAASDGSGVIGIDYSLKTITNLTNKVAIGSKGYATIIDMHKKYVTHPDQKTGTEIKDNWVDQLYQSKEGVLDYQLDGKAKKMSFVTNELTGWKIAGTMYSSEVFEATSSILINTLIVMFISILIGSFVIYGVIKSILRPLRILSENAEVISSGDLTQRIAIESNDEISRLGRSFNQMVESLHAVITNVKISTEQVSSASEQLVASAVQTSQVTDQVSLAIQHIASGAEDQTSRIEGNAKALEETLQGVLHISQGSTSVSQLSSGIAVKAQEGSEFMGNNLKQMEFIHESVVQSNEMMKSLSERSKEIENILDVIKEIAEQTNLLSLNASIEAARAGEHGRGFAVVANEVKKLAEQSNVSAAQISALIRSVQQETKSSVQLMEQVTSNVEDGVSISKGAADKFNEIMSSMRQIASRVGGVTGTMQQITASIQEVSSSANEISSIARENAAVSEEVAASSEEQLASMEEVTASARSLSKISEELQSLVNKFKV